MKGYRRGIRKEMVADIAGIQNCERYVNQKLNEELDFRCDRLVDVKCDGHQVKFSLVSHYEEGRKIRIIAKQISKKKFASADEGIGKLFPGYALLNWKERLRIEQEKCWLVIFEEK